MRSRFTINDFLDLEKEVDTKLHYRDACGGGVIELESQDDKTISQVKEFFNKKKIDISFSEDKKYIFTR